MGSGLIEVPGPTEAKRARVAVTRDHRVRRPQDLLQADELNSFELEAFGLAIAN